MRTKKSIFIGLLLMQACRVEILLFKLIRLVNVGVEMTQSRDREGGRLPMKIQCLSL